MSPSNEESIMILNVCIAQNRAKMGKTERKNTQIHNYSWGPQNTSIISRTVKNQGLRRPEYYCSVLPN